MVDVHEPAAYEWGAAHAVMAKVIGIPLHEDILPTSKAPLCLAPFWLRSDHLPAVD